MVDTLDELRSLIRSGWELWFVPDNDNRAIQPPSHYITIDPGKWELRRNNTHRALSVRLVEAIKANQTWFIENTTRDSFGHDLMYVASQPDLPGLGDLS